MTYLEPRSTTPPPGWYPNAYGQLQWWDGRNWGPAAPPQAPAVQPIAARKSVGVGYVLLIFLGSFGIHRFWMDRVGHGVAFIAAWLVSVFFGIATWESNEPAALFAYVIFSSPFMILFFVDLCVLARDVRAYNQQNGWSF